MFDVNEEKIPATGTVYVNVPDTLKAELDRIYKKHGIMGMEYIPGTKCLGVIVRTLDGEGPSIPIVAG